MNKQLQNDRYNAFAIRKIKNDIELQVPEGYEVTIRVSYGVPDKFHSMQGVYVMNRPWWKFWLPKTVNLYCIVEKTITNQQ